MALTDLKDLRARLADRALSLAMELFPGGHREGRDYVCPRRAAGGPGDSLKIAFEGEHKGEWYHHGEGVGGDLIDLVRQYRAGGEWGEAVRWCRRWLGLDPGEGVARTRRPEDVAAEAAAGARRQAQALAEEQARAEKGRRAAQAIYLGAQPQILDTPVDWYLRGRGIDVRRLEAVPRALRYHPALDYPWQVFSRPAPPGRERLPAMVAHVCGLDGQQLAVHRTYLDVLRPGAAVKARDVPDAKLSKAQLRSGLVRLSNGTMVEAATGLVRAAPALAAVPRLLPGHPEAGRAAGQWQSEAFTKIYIAEGIENALTFAVARPECRVAAAVSGSNMARVALPAFIREVVLIRDNDGDNAAAARAFANAVHWFRGHDLVVKEIAPPAGVKDLNDMVRGEV